MRSNRLQLNSAKTEVLWCASARQQHQISDEPLMVGSDSIQTARYARDLGIHLDSDISMRTDVIKTVSSCFAVLRQIRSIRQPTGSTVTCRFTCAVMAGLWQCNTGRHSHTFTGQNAVTPERGCSIGLRPPQVRSRDPTALRTPLASST